MLITRHFVFIHLPKTGGKFLRQLTEQHLADWIDDRGINVHAGYRKIPPDCADRPAFSLVRNPWDWYVSWYHFMQANTKQYGPEEPWTAWTLLADEGRHDFPTFVRRACEGVTSEYDLHWLREMKDADLDLYSVWFMNRVGSGEAEGRVEVGEFERLREDFSSFLARHDIPVGDRFVTALRDAPAVNVGDHRDYHTYYDAELRDLVAHKARAIIDRYGYRY